MFTGTACYMYTAVTAPVTQVVHDSAQLCSQTLIATAAPAPVTQAVLDRTVHSCSSCLPLDTSYCSCDSPSHTGSQTAATERSRAAGIVRVERVTRTGWCSRLGWGTVSIPLASASNRLNTHLQRDPERCYPAQPDLWQDGLEGAGGGQALHQDGVLLHQDAPAVCRGSYK